MKYDLNFVQLNEINFDVVDKYISAEPNRYLGLEKLLKLKKYTTFSEKAYELLEPWIQWASVNMEKTFTEHKIFRLGDAESAEHIQIFEKVEELEKQLDETVNSNVSVKRELDSYKKEETLREVSEDLADTEKEKLQKLSEGVDFEDSEQYKEKLEVIKENYFPKVAETTQQLTEEVENNETEIVEEVEPSVDFYAKALKRHNSK